MELSDEEAVRRVLAGEVEAFASLVARHWERCWRFARHQLGDPAEAEDAVQDAFVRAYASLHRCTEPSGFDRWLMVILVNRCRTRARRRAARERLVVVSAEAVEAAADRRGARSTADDALFRADIARALAQLEPDQREAFLLKHVEDMEYEDMARVTGVGISALKMRVKRARERLAALLSEVRYA